jgi:hypothetical protein
MDGHGFEERGKPESIVLFKVKLDSGFRRNDGCWRFLEVPWMATASDSEESRDPCCFCEKQDGFRLLSE